MSIPELDSKLDLSPELKTQLEKIELENIEYNLEILSKLNIQLETKLPKSKKFTNALTKNLYSDKINKHWFSAQCLSASNQIRKITNPTSKFMTDYAKILTKSDILKLSQELIYDISQLDRLTNYKEINWDNKILRSNFLTSNQFFLHAKFATIKHNCIPEITNRNFAFSTMPALIRQAIELKIKNMIGLEKVTTINGDFKFVPINSLISFFESHKKLFNMPVDFAKLKHINTWTNMYIHTGIIPFCWQSLEAIDIIEKLFTTEDSGNGYINLRGFSFISQEISLAELKELLDNKFNAVFTLNKDNIEGQQHSQPIKN